MDNILKEYFPIHSVNTRHGDRYVLEVVTRLPPTLLNPFRAHVWIRLYAPDGSVVSLGFYGERPITNLWEAVWHLVPRQGRVISPDAVELRSDPSELHCTAVEIHPGQIEELLDYLKALELGDACQFQVLDMFDGRNCAGFVGSIMQRMEFPIADTSFTFPIDIVVWQDSIERWRSSEIEKLIRTQPYVDNAQLDAIRYGLPYNPS